MKPSNIVFVSDFAHVEGGASKVAIMSAIALANAGYVIHFLSAVAPVDPLLEQSPVRMTLTGQIDILRDQNRFRAAWQGIWNRTAAKKMERLLHELDPRETVVHVQTWTKALSSSVVAIALRLGFPVVLSLHDYFSVCPTGGFYNFQSSSICPLRPMSIRCISEHCDSRSYGHKLWRVARHVVQDSAGGLPSGIRHFIASSEFSARIIRPHLPTNHQIYKVSNPVEIQKGPPVQVGQNIDFVFLGRLSPEKGASLMAKAASGSSVSTIFIGDGPSRNEVLSVLPATKITGWLSTEEVNRHMGNARALVFPSQCYEASPLSVVEAASRGIPAIVPDLSAACEMVENGVTGLWFKSGDAMDLREKMRQLLDPVVAQRMGQFAYQRFWESPPSLQRHVKELSHVYNAILSS